MEHPVYGWYNRVEERRSLFGKWLGWLWKKSARGMRRRTKGRRDPIDANILTMHRPSMRWGGEDASNRGIPWWGGDGRDGAPIETCRSSNENRSKGDQGDDVPSPSCVARFSAVWRFYCRKSTKYRRAEWWTGNLANATRQLQLRPQWLVAVVYVILLFHIVCLFLSSHPQRSSSLWSNRVTRGILKGFLRGFDHAIFDFPLLFDLCGYTRQLYYKKRYPNVVVVFRYARRNLNC